MIKSLFLTLLLALSCFVPAFADATSAQQQYLAAVLNKIRANVQVPQDTPRDSGVVCRARQNRSGEILSVEIVRSSGHADVDNAIVLAIKKSSPLPQISRPELFDPIIEFAWRNPN